ncbi:gamma-glutamyltransferase [Patiriisocius marinus]|uniref:Glutathione hydrolase proenzyme n=1 Tax=Patiriisocius marinus TaxID=1397112 RepID=A0A5J4J003_9FLAO|nr:gamma-glutamyltransferase [Patiriisocius marinus]GER59073.1 gamma-glutamyltransferase [Patiriisocius marinus]
MRKSLLLVCISLFLLTNCKETPKKFEKAKTPQVGLIAEKAMVVSAREEASKIGADIMKKGGNAFDAMVATEMALAVCYPYAGNLGGGGFMVYRTTYGELGALDYREKAPIKASRDMYLDETGTYLQEKSKVGGLAVGVPGTVAGIFAAHEKFGTLPIYDILTPVVSLARNGFKITKDQAIRFNKYAPVFKDVNKEESIYTKTYNEGDVFKNEALANTLQALIDEGRKAFYAGEIGEKLVSFLTKKESIITMADLAAYEAEWRDPVIFQYKNLKVISMSPPSSGGICLAQILKSIEPYNLKSFGHNTEKSIQIITEAERRAYADRSHFLGDPDYIDIPIDTLISSSYLLNRMASVSFDKATPSEEVSNGELSGYESMETTHYSIVDSFGNAIAVTTTLNAAFGSKLYVSDLGFFLNNEMDDFSAKPGTPNMFGLIGGAANAIEPQKRMLSSMTPTIVEKDGDFWMSVGTPGGSTIITSVLQTILNVYEYDMSMQDAVNAPRFHHQWLPDIIQFEPNSFNAEMLKNLETKGYTIDEINAPVIGKVDGILKLKDGTYEGGADKRGDDTAIGY